MLNAELGDNELDEMPQEWRDNRSARIEIKKGHQLRIAQLKATEKLPPCENTKTIVRGKLTLAPHVWLHVVGMLMPVNLIK